MLGFIKKDLLMVKANLKMLVIMIFVFIFITMNVKSSFSFLPTFISVMIMMSTFSYDEYNKTDAYISSLPNGKKNVVKAKYVATLLIIGVSFLLSFITSFLVGGFQASLNMENMVTGIVGSSIGGILLISILYPCIFKFGIEKSRIAIFVIVFGISGVVSLVMSQGFTIPIPQNIITLFESYGMFMITIATIILLFASYKISQHLYLKKEF